MCRWPKILAFHVQIVKNPCIPNADDQNSAFHVQMAKTSQHSVYRRLKVASLHVQMAANHDTACRRQSTISHMPCNKTYKSHHVMFRMHTDYIMTLAEGQRSQTTVFRETHKISASFQISQSLGNGPRKIFFPENCQ